MNTVEILETPTKSESDRKFYRVIKLSNGLKALLISDPAVETNESVIDSEKPNVSSTLIGSSTAERQIDGEKIVAESGNRRDHSIPTKLAACALTVDVGSFSDPRDVQGLAHFLGNIH